MIQCLVDGALQKFSLITITKAIAVTIALLTSSWLWMSMLLLALHSLSLINTRFLCDCDNAIYPCSSAPRPVRLSRSAAYTVQWAPVALPCRPTPPWQPGQPPLTSDLSHGLRMRGGKKKGSSLNSANWIWSRQGRALRPLKETHILGHCWVTKIISQWRDKCRVWWIV